MALVTFEDYSGNKVEVNPAMVISVSTYQHFDHDLVLPDELMVTNPDGNPEVSNDPKLLAKADELRTSERTVITFTGGSAVVKGDVAKVKKALG